MVAHDKCFSRLVGLKVHKIENAYHRKAVCDPRYRNPKNRRGVQ